jgi:hypothetical protein
VASFSLLSLAACDLDEEQVSGDDTVPVVEPVGFESLADSPRCFDNQFDYFNGRPIAPKATVADVLQQDSFYQNRQCEQWQVVDIAAGPYIELRPTPVRVGEDPNVVTGPQTVGTGLPMTVSLQTNKCNQRLLISMPGIGANASDDYVTIEHVLPGTRAYNSVDFVGSVPVGPDPTDEAQTFSLITDSGEVFWYTTSWREALSNGLIGQLRSMGSLQFGVDGEIVEDHAVSPVAPERLSSWLPEGETYIRRTAVMGGRTRPCGPEYVVADGRIGPSEEVCRNLYLFDDSLVPVHVVEVRHPSSGDDLSGDGKVFGGSWGVDADRTTGHVYIGSQGRLIQFGVSSVGVQIRRYFIDLGRFEGLRTNEPHWGREFAVENRLLVSFNGTDGSVEGVNSYSLWFLGSECAELVERFYLAGRSGAPVPGGRLTGDEIAGGENLIGLSLAPQRSDRISDTIPGGSVYWCQDMLAGAAVSLSSVQPQFIRLKWCSQ